MTSSATTAVEAVTTRPPEIGFDGKTTSWLPMSTAWPSSSGCEESMWKVVPDTLAAWDPGYGLFVERTLQCQPPQMTTWWNVDALSLGVNLDRTRLSIGPIVCPEAYTTATTITNAGGSTFVACCPSSYDFVDIFDSGNTGQCTSELEINSVVTYATRDTRSSWYTTTSTVTETSVAFAIQMNGWLFPETSTSLSTTESSGTAEATSTASDTASSTSEPDSGLSTGAKAGIGVGVSLGALAVLAVIGALLFRRRRQKKASTGMDSASEMYGSTPKSGVAIAELPARRDPPVELP